MLRPSNPVQPLVNRLSISQFLAYNQGIAQFHDRCRGAMSCSSTDYTTNYMNALAWVESQLQGMGYTTVRHNFNYSGNTGTNLWATKPGSVTPTQMYIISTHLDGRSGGDAFDDDGSGVALVMEIARVLSSPDVQTDVSVRFAFWDKEELGLYGAHGYVQDRRSLQGTLDEPTWLGVIQHDMILYDHGARHTHDRPERLCRPGCRMACRHDQGSRFEGVGIEVALSERRIFDRLPGECL